MPRSGTTYLYHALAGQRNRFTCFKLWEIVFAPSVLQKYFYIFLGKIDAIINNPVQKSITYLQNVLLRDINSIHSIGLQLPEEDEVVLLWDLSSTYLNFFFPDSNFFDDYFLFDQKLSSKKKSRIMRSYQRYVQRHNFVFNRKCEKTFLSKNPLMMGKLNALIEFFPDIKIININRNPKETLPSTIALNNKLYSFFTSITASNELNHRTKDLLVDLYKMGANGLNGISEHQYLKISFYRLIENDELEISKILNFSNLANIDFLQSKSHPTEQLNVKSKNKYQVLEGSELKQIMEEIPFMNEYQS
jgi:hypothetical protein